MAVSTGRRHGINSSVAIKAPVIAASTGNLTLSGEQTVDGIALVASYNNKINTGDRVLCKNQTSAVENGIYQVNTSDWSREPDWDGQKDVVEGTQIPVSRGTVNTNTMWRVTNTGTITIGTTETAFDPSTVTVASGVSYTPAGTGAVATTSQDKHREIVSVFDFMTAAEKDDAKTGTPVLDPTTNIQKAFDHLSSNGLTGLYLPEGVFKYTSLTMATDIHFTGTGILTGPAPSGTRPTATTLLATNEAGRLSALETYYTGEITLSASVSFSGSVSFKDTLIKSSGKTLSIDGHLELDDVSFHDVAPIVSLSGSINSTSEMIASDSPNDGIMCRRGGSANAPSLISLHSTERGAHIQFGGEIVAASSVIRNSTKEGVFINQGGTFQGANSNISDGTLSGVLINYGGSMNLEGVTIDSNGAAGIVSESQGAIYAINSTITDNGTVGIDCSYDGLVQATGATITGNGEQAVRVRTGGIVNILTATVDRTNNGGAAPLLWVQGRGVIYSEDESGTGKTALNANDYEPLFNEMSGIAWIGDWTTHEDTAHRANYYGLNSDNSDVIMDTDGEITFIAGWMSVNTFEDAAADDLVTINGGINLTRCIITAKDSTHTVVVKHGTGNIYLDGGVDFSLDHVRDTIELIFQWGVWCELSRSTNS